MIENIKKFDYLSFLLRFTYYIPFVIIISPIIMLYFSLVYKKRLYKKLVFESDHKLTSNLGSLNNFCILGPIGSNKSLLGLRVVSVLATDKIYKATQRYNYLRSKLIFSYIDVSKLEIYIDNYFDYDKYYQPKELKKFITVLLEKLSIDPENTVKLKFVTEPVNIVELLEEFILLRYYSYFRVTNVLSNVAMKPNNISSVILTEPTIEFERISKIPTELYTIFFEDEKGIIDNAQASVGMKENKVEDKGKHYYSMLLRHFTRGTSTYVSIVQRSEDIRAALRRMYQAFIYINPRSRKEYTVFDNEIYLLSKLFSYIQSKYNKKMSKKSNHYSSMINYTSYHSYIPIPYFFSKERIKSKGIELRDKLLLYQTSNNNYNKLLKNISEKIEDLEEFLILKREVQVHYSATSLGKDIYKEDSIYDAFGMNIFLPAKEVYTQYSTYNYSFIKEKLNADCEESLNKARRWSGVQSTKEEIKYSDYDQLNALLFDDVLKKEVKKLEKDLSKTTERNDEEFTF